MSDFKEETYSAIFSSLKHPVRRKILRILANKKLTFSEILEILNIDSGHLSYHLESLEDLISKSKKGKYKLSFLGEAAITTMSKVEEVPLNKKWNTKIVSLIILIGLLLAGLVYVQSLYSEINELDQANEVVWSQYLSLVEPSIHSPPFSELEAIQKAIEMGKWNATRLKGKTIDTNLIYFKFEQRTINDDNNRTFLFPVTGESVNTPLHDYSPKNEGNSIYRYTWTVIINPIQNSIYDVDSGTLPYAKGYYYFDAFTGDVYTNISGPLFLDSYF